MKTTLVLLLAALTVFAVSGCNKGNDGGGDAQSRAVATAPKTGDSAVSIEHCSG